MSQIGIKVSQDGKGLISQNDLRYVRVIYNESGWHTIYWDDIPKLSQDNTQRVKTFLTQIIYNELGWYTMSWNGI